MLQNKSRQRIAANPNAQKRAFAMLFNCFWRGFSKILVGKHGEQPSAIHKFYYISGFHPLGKAFPPESSFLLQPPIEKFRLLFLRHSVQRQPKLREPVPQKLMVPVVGGPKNPAISHLLKNRNGAFIYVKFAAGVPKNKIPNIPRQIPQNLKIIGLPNPRSFKKWPSQA
jgi:hypothetical protein